jgi:hypothetical protein
MNLTYIRVRAEIFRFRVRSMEELCRVKSFSVGFVTALIIH